MPQHDEEMIQNRRVGLEKVKHVGLVAVVVAAAAVFDGRRNHKTMNVNDVKIVHYGHVIVIGSEWVGLYRMTAWVKQVRLEDNARLLLQLGQ